MKKSYVLLTPNSIKNKSLDDLMAMRAKLAHTVNESLRSLEKAGLTQQSHFYQNIALDNAITGKAGKPRFSEAKKAPKGATKEFLLREVNQMMRWASKETRTIKGTREQIKRLGEAAGIPESDWNDFAAIVNTGVAQDIKNSLISSDEMFEAIEEGLKNDKTPDYITNALEKWRTGEADTFDDLVDMMRFLE